MGSTVSKLILDFFIFTRSLSTTKGPSNSILLIVELY